jgi:DNA-binding NtrC family response regulator
MIKILIIDDDENFAWSLKDMVEALGEYKGIVAIGGKAGFKAAKKEAPDLILCDFEMPDLAGNELMKKLNKKSRTNEIPVIMVSGLRTEEAISKSYHEYAEQYIFKPVEPDQLKTAIEKALAYSEMRK